MDAGEQADEIIFATQREHCVDQVVTDTGFALLDLEAVGEEVEDNLFGNGIRTQTYQRRCNSRIPSIFRLLSLYYY